MNKAYLLVICVLAASFAGCLSDDTSDLEEQQNTEDETIEPVGNHNNETHDYDILIGEIQNLTDEIDNLNEQIDILSEDLQSLESYRYNPPENSSHTIFAYQCALDYNQQNFSNGINRYCSWGPAYDILKNGNEITIHYEGAWTSENLLFNSSTNCSDDMPRIEFYNVDGVLIFQFYTSLSSMSQFVERNEDGCSFTEDYYGSNGYESYGKLSLWKSLKFTLPEETARIAISGGISGYEVGGHFTFA